MLDVVLFSEEHLQVLGMKLPDMRMIEIKINIGITEQQYNRLNNENVISCDVRKGRIQCVCCKRYVKKNALQINCKKCCHNFTTYYAKILFRILLMHGTIILQTVI